MLQNEYYMNSISKNIVYSANYLTMIYSLLCAKIRNASQLQQCVFEEPDNFARLFLVTLHALKVYVFDEEVLGNVKTPVRVAAFQEKGVPNIHSIFFMTLQSNTQLLDANFITSVNWAEILSTTSAPLLEEVLLKQNMYKLYVICSPPTERMKDGTCTMQFSKDAMIC